MKWSSFKYLTKQGLHSMVQNRLMTLASVGVLTACLIITGVAVLLSVNVNSFVDYLSDQNEFEVYLNDGYEQASIDAFVQNVSALENVAETEYISKSQAVEEMQAWMGEDGDLLSSYAGEDNAANPLPASVRVRVEDLTALSQTVESVKALGGDMIYEVQSPTELSSVLVGMKRAVTYVGWGLVAVLGVVSVVVISNTIRLTVFARRKEINIMKFVGATNAFIRLPFFVEGMTVGAISGIVSTLVVGGVYYGLLQWLDQPSASWLGEFTRCMHPMSEVIWPMLGGFVLFGVFIGGVGCATSIRKHLKV